MKKFSRRQLLLLMLLVVAAICAVLGIILGVQLLLYVESILLMAGLFVVLRATERGDVKGFRKTEKLERNLRKDLVGVEGKLEVLATRLEGFGSNSSRGNALHPANSELPNQIDSFLQEMNALSTGGAELPLSARVSIKKIVDWLNPTLVLTTDTWSEMLRRELEIDTESWTKVSSALMQDSAVNLVIVDGKAFQSERSLLMTKNYLRTSALMLVENGYPDRVSSISGFTEVAPAGVMHGVRLFYPSAALEPEKFSKLVDYA